ncbi:MAG TPA: hypothetical protein VK388_00725 [Pyrinomonadaceae bacterium]|nr:hypothetical protein [Pyrinomonadaceae bacterium]
MQRMPLPFGVPEAAVIFVIVCLVRGSPAMAAAAERMSNARIVSGIFATHILKG